MHGLCLVYMNGRGELDGMRAVDRKADHIKNDTG